MCMRVFEWRRGGYDHTTTKTLVSISVRASLLLGCRTWLVYVRHITNTTTKRERRCGVGTELSAHLHPILSLMKTGERDLSKAQDDFGRGSSQGW